MTKRRPSVSSIDEGGHRDRVLAARDRLVEQHLDLVPQIAKRVHKFLPPSFDLEDLIGVGNLALIRIATVYRPKKHGGTPFSAFARHRLRGAMIDSVRRRHFIENTRQSIDDGVYMDLGDHMLSKPEVDGEIDRARLMDRLASAVNGLAAEQRQLLDQYYAEAENRLKQAHWRRRLEVVKMHEAILEILRKELAS